MKKEQRLSLEAFKSKNINPDTSGELEKLTGGILGDCHPGFWKKLWNNLKHLDGHSMYMDSKDAPFR